MFCQGVSVGGVCLRGVWPGRCLPRVVSALGCLVKGCLPGGCLPSGVCLVTDTPLDSQTPVKTLPSQISLRVVTSEAKFQIHCFLNVI